MAGAAEGGMKIEHWILAFLFCLYLSVLAFHLGKRPTEKQMRAVVADEMCKTLVASRLAQSCTPSAQ
jgi:hypothetical protein